MRRTRLLEHVSLHAVHPHNAPFADVVAQKLLDEAKGPPSLDLKFFDEVVKDVAAACRESLAKTKRFTHIGIGSATVKEVASNRRVLGQDGKVKFTRTSATKSKEAREAARRADRSRSCEHSRSGTATRSLAALHYYATHPMSYYGDGRVSADFCGLARQKLQDETRRSSRSTSPAAAATSPRASTTTGRRRTAPILRDRMYRGHEGSLEGTKRIAVKGWEWRIEPVKLPPRNEASFGEEESRKTLEDEKATKAKRGNAALPARVAQATGPADRHGLPRLRRQGARAAPAGRGVHRVPTRRPEDAARRAVFVAGYGDDGCGYIPTAPAYLEGGYEPTVALAAGQRGDSVEDDGEAAQGEVAE